MEPLCDFYELPSRPSWDVDGGKWYVCQTVAKDGPTRMYRHKPNLNLICEPLMGSSMRDSEGFIVGVRYPPLRVRMRIFREGIELIRVFRDYADLFTLALFRRQVCDRDMQMDKLLFNLGCDARLGKSDWARLAERMPEGTWVRDACERRGSLGPEHPQSLKDILAA